MAALHIVGELNIQQAAAQRDAMLAWLAQTAPADDAAPDAPDAGVSVLDLGQVEAFDSAGVQLVLALQRSLAGRGQALQLGGASPPVADALNRFGLQALLATADAAPVPAGADD